LKSRLGAEAANDQGSKEQDIKNLFCPLDICPNGLPAATLVDGKLKSRPKIMSLIDVRKPVASETTCHPV